MHITKSAVESATYQGKHSIGKDGKSKWSRCVLWDDDLTGFGLRVTPADKKSFVLLYRPDGSSRQRFMTLGAFGALTVDEARRKAKRELGKAADGRDPLAERQAKRAAETALHLGTQTVAELADRYLEYSQDRKKESSLKDDRQRIRDYIKPQLGSRRIVEVRTADIVALHESLKDRPYAANRLLALLKRMFNLAKTWDDRPAGAESLRNPCDGVEKFDEEARERYLNAQELGRLGELLAVIEQQGQIPGEALGQKEAVRVIPSAVTTLRLIIFTGCRRNEIQKLKWKDIDFGKSRITLPDSKTGSRLFPVGAVVLEVLSSAPRKKGNPYVCWGQKANGYLVGLPKIWGHIQKAADLEGVRLHDLRHTFASVGVGSVQLNLPVVGKLLGHSQVTTTQRYAHLDTNPIKAAADLITTELAASLNGQSNGGQQSEEALLAELIARAQSLSVGARQRLVAAIQA